MKLIKPSFEIIEQLPGEEGIYKQIELAGRVCWKSENKITEDSYKNFIEMLKSKQHLSVLEHGTIYLKIPNQTHFEISTKNHRGLPANFYGYNPHSIMLVDRTNDPIEDAKYTLYVTTNLRILYESNRLDDLKYLCEPENLHERRVTVRFILDRAIANEFVRHRVFSFAQESTRYCNYSNKDKFGNEITYILPLWVDERQLGEQNSQELLIQMGNLDNPTYSQKDLNELYFLFGLASSEIQYFNLINGGWTPQQARSILPNSLKTELVMTGFVDDWKHFFELRCASSAHPQARELAEPLYSEFVKRGYL